jgi:hypothetical protein
MIAAWGLLHYKKRFSGFSEAIEKQTKQKRLLSKDASASSRGLRLQSFWLFLRGAQFRSDGSEMINGVP